MTLSTVRKTSAAIEMIHILEELLILVVAYASFSYCPVAADWLLVENVW